LAFSIEKKHRRKRVKGQKKKYNKALFAQGKANNELVAK
jgi:hypothetical protein